MLIKKNNTMKILQTAIYEIETAAKLEKIIDKNENVMCVQDAWGQCVFLYIM